MNFVDYRSIWMIFTKNRKSKSSTNWSIYEVIKWTLTAHHLLARQFTPFVFPLFYPFTLNLHWNHLILGNFNKYLPYQIIKSCTNFCNICDEFDYLRRRRRRRKWISDDKMVGGVVALGPCCARWPLFPLYALLNFCSSRDYLLIFRYNIGRHDAWWQRGPSGF